MSTRIVMIADTHLPKRAKKLPAELWAAMEEADVVLHAGDWVDEATLDELEARCTRVIGVYGNNDGTELRSRLPEVARFELDGVRFAMIHETGPATGREARSAKDFPDMDVLVFGHSHIPWDTTSPNGLRLLNPGSPTDRRRQPHCTYLTATADQGELRDIMLHALDRPRPPATRNASTGASPVLLLIDASGARRADPLAPQLLVTDWGATRGDGVFESISVIDGRMPPLEARFDRLEASSRALDLPLIDRAVWAEALKEAIRVHDPVERLAVTVAVTRGVEGSNGSPTAWMLARPARDFTGIRHAGVSVVTLDRGYASDAAEGAPWLLLGAKHLSYATNSAALREASRRGADDVIFTSTDGLALEGPTSSLIVRRADRVVSPSVESGILAGTTQTTAFRFFESRGLDTAFDSVLAEDLPKCNAIWLVSSVRQAVAVHTLDGHRMPVDPEMTAALNEWLSAAD